MKRLVEVFYTKADYENMLLSMVEPLKQYFSSGKSRLELGSFAAGYGHRIAGMEGFSRILWGLVPYWKGGGEDKSLLPIIIEGLCNGTNPGHEEYWGNLQNKDQRMVEMAAISNGLLLIPELLWEPLTERQKDNLSNWLYQINLYSQAENNWQFFNTLTNLALKKLGRKYSPERMQEAIDKYESFYLGNGWYSDGKRPQKDYYSSFAIQYYCMLYAYYEKENDPERSILYRERARKFAETFLYWFDEEGRALPFGRSLTYRFGQAAFWSAYIMTEVEGLSLGVLKGILGRHLRFWMSQPIFDHGGVLTVGYQYPNLMMSEGYNAPGSPYWAFKAFAFLALPKEHPFWEVKEEPLPQKAPLKVLSEADMLMASQPDNVIAYTAGQYSVLPYTHDAEKYEKFAYSTKYGFSVPRSYCNVNDCAPDSMLAFEIQGMLYVRRRCEEYHITENEVWSKWSPYPGIMVETLIRPTAKGHIRIHRIESNRECICYDCGFAYPYEPEETNLLVETKEGTRTDGEILKTITAESRVTNVIVQDARGFSGVSFSANQENQGSALIVNAAPNTNLNFPLSRIPARVCEIKPGIVEMETYVEAGSYV